MAPPSDAPASASEPELLLEMIGITKSFPGVKALDGVNFRLRKGEVHALIGENGAGKSTLIKILTGVYRKDAGALRLGGTAINPQSSLQAQQLGISSIYQELNLIGTLSVAENIFIGREPRTKWGLIDWASIERRARELLETVGIAHEVDVTQKLSRYGTSIQQMVAIARAISIDARVIVMDESTSSLNEREVKKLFDVVRRLKQSGIAVVFISHRLDELFEICDRMTVLRDGRLVGEYPVRELTKLSLVSAMIGRDASTLARARRQPGALPAMHQQPLLEARQLQSGSKVKSVSLVLNAGEVLGIAGLLGSGRSETAQLLFGDLLPESGGILVAGQARSFGGPAEAIQVGIALCPEDRKQAGIFPHMSVLDNLTIVLLPELSKRGIVDRKKQREIAAKYVAQLGIKTADLNQEIRNLSGGNQQKVILSRWLCKSPKVMILDEPTRGIDVGAKSEIAAIVEELASAGIGVILISSELEELTQSSDRIVVLREGRNIAELSGTEIRDERIAEVIAQGA